MERKSYAGHPISRKNQSFCNLQKKLSISSLNSDAYNSHQSQKSTILTDSMYKRTKNDKKYGFAEYDKPKVTSVSTLNQKKDEVAKHRINVFKENSTNLYNIDQIRQETENKLKRLKKGVNAIKSKIGEKTPYLLRYDISIPFENRINELKYLTSKIKNDLGVNCQKVQGVLDKFENVENYLDGVGDLR